MYIKVPPQPFIRRRKRVRFGPPPAPPPTALTLVAAEYNHDDSPVLVLTFDRAVDIAGLDGSQMIVDDGFDLGLKFIATGPATLDAPGVLRIGLTDDGDATVPGTVLTAGAGNGIIAADDAAAWAGVADLGLPFP